MTITEKNEGNFFTEKEIKVIAKYIKKGWTFIHEEYTNYHNGNSEDDFLFKSPRLHENRTT